MIRSLSCFLLVLLSALHASAAAPEFQPLPNPAAPTAATPFLSTGLDGTVWLSWTEPVQGTTHRLMTAAFNAPTGAWLAPIEVARGSNWLINRADTPQVVAGAGGQLAAVWYVQNGRQEHDDHGSYSAWTSVSPNSGASWSPPAALSSESRYNEFVSLVPVRGGRWLAAWLDGRAKADGGASRLYGRVLGEDAADALLDDRVCDCCPTTFTSLPDGGALVVYRDRSPEEIRDLAGQRWHEGRWSPAQGLPRDGWKIDGCPVNGPVLTRAGSRVGLAWFTGADHQPRVQAALTTDFAVQWPLAKVLSTGEPAPAGRVGAVLLRDGTLWTSWLQVDGSVALGPLALDGTVTPPQRVPGFGGAAAARVTGTPRLAWVGSSPAAAQRVLLALPTLAADGQPAGVHTILATVAPAPPTPAARPADDCGCDQQGPPQGHAAKGRVVRLLAEQESVLVAHEEVPGVMRAMTMAFRVDPRLLQFLQPGQDISGRMERRDDGRWWLFNVRIDRTM